VASWLVCLPLDQEVWVQALAGDIVLCSEKGKISGLMGKNWRLQD